MAAVFVLIILLPTDLTLLPQVNTWDTDVDLPVILVMADTVIGTTGIIGTLIAIVHRVVDMRGTAIVTEGTIEIGENAGVHPQPTGVAEDTRLNIGAGEVTQGAHRGEEALAATGSQTVRVVPASPQQMVQIHVGEVGAIPGDENRNGFNTLKQLLPTTARPTILVPPFQVCFLSCDCFAPAICLSLLLKMCKPDLAV
jgi:hypothetical protein